ncbi:MAG TPA: four helix bundle protein [Thermoanaerobaculia bacterium]
MNTLRDRSKAFAIRVIRVCATLPRNDAAGVIRMQLLRSGTSPGAHCREAFRSRSDAEMISKIETALQELDESLYWMELLIEGEIVPAARLQPLMQEADELIAMGVASVRTIKRRRKN